MTAVTPSSPFACNYLGSRDPLKLSFERFREEKKKERTIETASGWIGLLGGLWKSSEGTKRRQKCCTR